MNKFIVASRDDLRVLIVNTAEKMGVSEAVVEKDYWVTYVLDYLFNHNKWKDYFTFKGGTSLSKCFGLIDRFSEDIDLILDWTVLGYGHNEPWKVRSKTKQAKFNKEVNQKTVDFLRDEFLEVITEDFKKILNSKFNFTLDKTDEQTILFEYPKIFTSTYLTQSIRLEIGALAIKIPSIKVEIEPYIGEHYPSVFKYKAVVDTVTSERTFWEKVTILHHEANRPLKSSLPARYARHYYDIYRMANSKVKDDALNNQELLQKVVNFKIKFYPRNWANYEEALKNKIKLLPIEKRLIELEQDYKYMEEMLYGNYPTFKELIEVIRTLENEINLKFLI